MTRILAEMVGGNEHLFRNTIAKLERASGHPNHDIRLTAEVVQSAQRKLHELGLDPHDTHGPELYAALQERMKQDNARLVARLTEVGGDPEDALSGITHALQTLPLAGSCFAIKTTVVKRLLKKTPPKKAMKQLGYRSFESMLKHEPVIAIMAVAWSVESVSWRKSFTDHYAKLQASDFETRAITVIHPKSAKWVKLGKELVLQHKHSVLSFKELGGLVLLPLPKEEQPPAFTLTTLILALQSMNEIRAASSFLRLQQVQPNFGSLIHQVSYGEPQLVSEQLDEPVAWRVVQRFYARFKEAFNPEAFELAIQRHDLSWHSIERSLERVEPTLAFWHGTEHLSLLHERQPVSFNILDVAMACCNKLPFQSRLVDHARQALNQELLLRYLQPESVEQLVRAQLQPELAMEIA